MTTEGKIRRASLIVAAGLILQFLSLIPLHPLAFVSFVGLGLPVMGVGVLLFLWCLLTSSAPSDR